jgi:hypothetical protein
MKMTVHYTYMDKVQNESPRNLTDAAANVLLEEYKLGMNSVHILHQDSIKIGAYIITLTSVILGLIFTILRENPTLKIRVFSSDISLALFLSSLSGLLIIGGFLTIVTLRLWMLVYSKRVLDIENIFHKSPEFGVDVACLITNCTDIGGFKGIARYTARFGEFIIYIILFIYMVCIIAAAIGIADMIG